MGDLHSLTGQLTQPMSLNFVSHSVTWHITLADIACGKLITTMLDQEKSKGCNNFMFENPNPEAKPTSSGSQQPKAAVGKNKLLKLQAVFNMQPMPQHIQEASILQKLSSLHQYEREFEFDRFSRITQSTTAGQDDSFITESSAKNKTKACTLESCLSLMGKDELLRGDNAYDCSTCKGKQVALKRMEVYEVPNILILTL